MKNESLNKFQKLSKVELGKIEEGWKLFGTEETPIEGSNCMSEIDECCHQKYYRKRYFLGIVVSEYPISGGCSFKKGQDSQCESCTFC